MIPPNALVYVFILVSPFAALAEGAGTYKIISTPLFTIGGHETLLMGKEITEYQEIFMKEALENAPSVNLNGNGPTGRQVDFTIRGARSPQNLVLVDGIYVNDPASGGGVDLADYLNADLERIEVLPGPLTLAYGPGALGGVLQFIPKKGKGKPSLSGKAEGGSFLTQNGSITGQGEDGPLQFSTTIVGFGRGSAPFNNPIHRNRQGDNYRNGTFSSRIGYALTDNWELEGLIRYIDAKVQFDDPRFDPKVSTYIPFEANNFTDTRTLLTSLDNKWGDEVWEHFLKVAYSRIQRNTTIPFYHNSTLGEHPFLVYRSTYAINEQHTLLGGLEGGQERSQTSGFHRRNHGGLFLIHTFKPFDWTALKAGLRGDIYQFLWNRLTFSVGADQKVTSTTTLRTSYGTNFKPPVLSDLFQEGPYEMANPFLKPERSQSFEAGVDQTFCDQHIKASVTGFLTIIDNVALSRRVNDGKWQRYNGEQRKTKGLELALSGKPLKTLKIKGALTLTKARDFPGNKQSPFIPSAKLATGAHWQALPKLALFVQGYVVTSRIDSATKRKLPPYGVINAGGSYDILDNASLFFRIENLTDKRYEEVFGYGTRGRAFFIGIEAKT